ncbi:hypothetical protein Tco_1257604, partial [Tanacetum coccineum]
EGSFNLNSTTEDKEDEVHDVRPSRPMGRDQAKRKGEAPMSPPSSADGVDVVNEYAMVNDPCNVQRGQNMIELLQIKKLELELKAKELEIRQMDQLLLNPLYLRIALITEYLVNISKRHTFWSLNEDILKITVLTTNTPYPSRKIWRIHAYTYQRPQRKQVQYAVSRKGNTSYSSYTGIQYSVEDIKRGPYSKKLQYVVSNTCIRRIDTDRAGFTP